MPGTGPGMTRKNIPKRAFSFRTHLAGIFAGISAFRFSFGQDLFALTNR
jgi:hypothetical protein